MKRSNASTLKLMQKRVEKLMREGEDLKQMKEDIRMYGEFRKMLIHCPCDG